MKVQPLLDRVLVKRKTAEAMIGSIVIPDIGKEKPNLGEIVAIGPGRPATDTGVLMPMGCKIGQTVLFGRYGGHQVELDGIDYILLRHDEVFGIVSE